MRGFNDRLWRWWWWLIKFSGCALWIRRSNHYGYVQRFVLQLFNRRFFLIVHRLWLQ